jgi:hypothetical protein
MDSPLEGGGNPGYTYVHKNCKQFGPSGCAILTELDERLCGNAKPVVQPADHFERQGTRAVEYLMRAIAVAMNGMKSSG